MNVALTFPNPTFARKKQIFAAFHAQNNGFHFPSSHSAGAPLITRAWTLRQFDMPQSITMQFKYIPTLKTGIAHTMNEKIRHLLDQMSALEDDLRREVQAQEANALYQIKGKQIEFEAAVRQAHLTTAQRAQQRKTS